MCGILGIWNFDGKHIDLKNLQVATNIMRHRGPDDEGYFLINTRSGKKINCRGNDTDIRLNLPLIDKFKHEEFDVAFGFRRLAILDLSPAGHQPMLSADGRLSIIFNGEIYNYLDLRTELTNDGYSFHTATDTEVILAAYDRWGLDCLSRFNGMWAFAIYDSHAHTLFLARDRFGVKPLYYWVSPQGFVAFASEIKAFSVLPGWKPYGNGQRIYDFLVYGILDHTDETMFCDVFQMAPGSYAHWPLRTTEMMQLAAMAGNKLPTQQWYQLKPMPFSGNLMNAAEGFCERLTDSVRLRLRADVPVGSCLSGGLDSSSIVCIANRLLREQGVEGQQKTYSACTDVARFDERLYIDKVVADTGVHARYTYPSMDALFNLLPDLSWYQDEPFGSTSIFAQWCVFELATRAGVKVMLDGQGADEMLAGYHSFFGQRLAGLLKRFKLLSMFREWNLIHTKHGYSNLTLARWTTRNCIPALAPLVATICGTSNKILAWLDIRRLGVEPDDFGRRWDRCGTTVQEVSNALITLISVPMLLHWEDRNSMAHSIESRVPFLDYRLVEYVLGLPDEFKISEGVTKRVLREGMRNILPEEIRWRMDKVGFATPEEIWMREKNTAYFRELLSEAISLSGGILKREVFDIFDNTVAGVRQFDFLIWRIISFGVWVKRFGVVLPNQ